MSSVDELDDFSMGGTMRRSASASDAASKYREAQETKQFGVDDLDSFFSSGPRSSSVPKSRTATEVRTTFEMFLYSIFQIKKNLFYMCILILSF